MVLAYEAYVIHYASFSRLVTFSQSVGLLQLFFLLKAVYRKIIVKSGFNETKSCMTAFAKFTPQFCSWLNLTTLS